MKKGDCSYISRGHQLSIPDNAIKKNIDDTEVHDLLSDIKVDGFLQKPFSMGKLNDIIDKTMQDNGQNS